MTLPSPNPGLRVGADRLVLAGVPVVADALEHEISVRLEADGDVIIDDRVPMKAFRAGDVVWDLPRRLPPDVGAIALTLSSGLDAPWFVLTAVVLAEARPFETLDGDGASSWEVVTPAPWVRDPPPP